MKLAHIPLVKIKKSNFFEYPEIKNKKKYFYESYEPYKLIKNKENYLLVDGYLRWENIGKKQQKFLVYEEKEFLNLWKERLIEKFYQGRTNWIFIYSLLEKTAIHYQQSLEEFIEKIKINTIIPNAKVLQTLKQMSKHQLLLKKIMPLESWNLQNYKSFQKINEEELDFFLQKLEKFQLNFSDYRKILDILFVLARLKKKKISVILDNIFQKEISLEKFQSLLFAARNPVYSQLLEKRKKALAQIQTPKELNFFYNQDLENSHLIFTAKIKNKKDWQKILYFFKNNVVYDKKLIDNLLNLL